MGFNRMRLRQPDGGRPHQGGQGRLRNGLHVAIDWTSPHWAPPPLPDRLDMVGKLRQLVNSRRQQLLELLASIRRVEPLEVLTSEILPFLDACQWLEKHAARVLQDRKASFWSAPPWMLGHRLQTRRMPYGRVLIFGPGNYPFFLPAAQALQALVAGNRVRLKPQVGCSQPMELLRLWLLECGLPAHAIEVLPADIPQVEKLIEEGVELFVLTGAGHTGRLLLPKFAEKSIPCIAELSGTDVFVICADADLAAAKSALTWARRLNHGQTCMAPQQVWAPSVLQQRLQDLPLAVRYFEQTSQLQQALRETTGLGVSLFGEAQALELLEHCRTGFVVHNDCIVPTADPRACFGGTGPSGFGVTRGAEGLLAMTVPQNVFCNRGPRMHLAPPNRFTQAILSSYCDICHGNLREKTAGLAKMVPQTLGWLWSNWRSKGFKASSRGEFESHSTKPTTKNE